MKNKLGLLILCAGFGFGIVRLLVGAAILAQLGGLLALPALAEGINDVTVFMAERADRQLLPLPVPAFFAYIAIMGGLLMAGATGVFFRRQWGFFSLYGYLALHAALFINYLEVNPKLVLWVVQCIAVYWLRSVRPPESDLKAISCN